MILIVLLTVLTLGGIIVERKWGRSCDMIGSLVAIISGVSLAVMLFAIPINRHEVNKNIEKYRITEQAIKLSRAENRQIENAAIQHKVIEINQWLVGAKYDNSNMWDLWIPDEVNNLELIE